MTITNPLNAAEQDIARADGWLVDCWGGLLAKVEAIPGADGVAMTIALTDSPVTVEVAFMSRADAVRLGKRLMEMEGRGRAATVQSPPMPPYRYQEPSHKLGGSTRPGDGGWRT